MNNFMGYSQEHMDAREAKICKFFTVLGVDATPERVTGYVEETLSIPWLRNGIYYFTGALRNVVRAKDDGFQTAPQPGVIWSAAQALIPKREHYAGHLPLWWRQIEDHQDQKAIGTGKQSAARLVADKHWLIGDGNGDEIL